MVVRGKRRAVRQKPRKVVPAEVASVYQPLLRRLQGERHLLRTLGVTGCGSSGSTTVAMQLAATAAEQSDRPVLLVDAHLARPAIAERFDAVFGCTLADLADDRDSLDEVAQPASVANLHLASLGPIEPAALDGLLETLSPRFGLVIFDLPELAVGSLALASKLDGVLLVLAAGRTHHDIAQETLRRLERGRVQVLGAVLNHGV